ncbi:family 43 glycosylhydrolase [Paenibacillus sp. 1P07SE]|uniref:family 43 glycosylhydrolase n=1 Tax=Paenibacillus sp. 1P07SE TaxID=3132209 RepID=UPI0039A46741
MKYLAVRSAIGGTLVLAAALVLGGCDTDIKPEAIDMSSYESVYANPFPSLEQEWEDYGNGDPFVMRYDGRYYLYVSTKDHRAGIKAWESDDLVHWRYAGLVTEDPVSTGAYAPEVFYWNGSFYLYTSPAGQGHYVYRSESPTGPFERITDNLGMSIDGSVFIDDDGSWTFTHAGTGGIVGVPMDDPVTFGSGRTLEGTFLGHWTEGSMIIKRGGIYYMTLTGNHVFSKGYRVHYAVSEDSPLGPYTMPANNPIAISTTADFFGLGHSSTVMGPDLDSYYLVYHNLVGSSAEGPPVRQMNIDRLVFNGKKMDVLGPTNYDQPVPRQPDFSDRLDESVSPDRWHITAMEHGRGAVSQASTEEVYTAEFNVQPLREGSGDTQLELLFGYRDEANYASVALDFAAGQALLVHHADGQQETLGEAVLPADVDWTKLHNVRLERGESSLRLYVDARLILEVIDEGRAGAGGIGYRYEGEEPLVSYVAFANSANGSSDFETAKPLPGTVEAVHYLGGRGRGFHVGQTADAPAWRIADGTDVRETEDGSYSVTLSEKGDWLRYALNVSQSGTYAIDFTVGSAAVPAKVEVIVDGQSAGTFNVEKPEGLQEATAAKVRAGTIELEQGFRDLQLKLAGGQLAWLSADFNLVDTAPFHEEALLSSSGADDIHGAWSRDGERYAGASDGDVKMYGGNARWSDYTIETTVESGDAPSGETGLLLRVTNESDFVHQVQEALMGYYVSVSSGKLQLYRLNYDSTLVDAVRITFPRNESVRLRVEAEGSTIRAYWGDEPDPVLTYVDPDVFMQGRAGIRSVYADQLTIGDLSVTSLPAP